MDEKDLEYAARIEQLERDEAVYKARSLIDIEREHLKKLEDKGVVVRCRYCESPVEGYTSRYCDSECQQLDEELRAAERRNNG